MFFFTYVHYEVFPDVRGQFKNKPEFANIYLQSENFSFYDEKKGVDLFI